MIEAPTAASFLRVAGLPVVQRVALSALRAGCAPVWALAGKHGDRLSALFAGDPRTRSVIVVDEAPETAHAALRLPSDCVIAPETLRSLFASESVDERGPAALRLRRLRRRSLSRAQSRGSGRTEDRELADPFVLSVAPEPVEGAESKHAPRKSTLPLGEGEGVCVPVREPCDVVTAERALIAALRRATADTDGPIARLDRALSTGLSLWLTRTPLRPNHVTTIGTAIGLFGACALAQGTHGWVVLGAVLFWAAVIVDGCDGELARLTFRESRFGGLYDVVTDNVVHVAIFLGIGLGLHRAAPDWNYVRVLGVLLGGFACALIATVVCLLPHPPVRQLRPRTRKGRLRQGLLRGFEALMNRDFAYVVLAFATVDRLAWFLWATAVGTYVYAAGLVWVYRWRNAE